MSGEEEKAPYNQKASVEKDAYKQALAKYNDGDREESVRKKMKASAADSDVDISTSESEVASEERGSDDDGNEDEV